MPVQALQLLLPLAQVDLDDRPVVGGKAAVLGTLVQAGLPVPAGFCIPWHVWELDDVSVWQAVEAEYRRLCPAGEPVTVRSSGVAEDSAAASYAGQFESILNVNTLGELKDAIQQCRASALSTRAAAYREHQDQPVGELAVLVQRQVQARWSGVLFTHDPRTGLAGTLWVEMVEGIGEDLVGGRAKPHSFRLDRQGNLVEGQELAVSLAGVWKPLAALSQQIEELLGPGQDIEWAIDPTGRVWILQTRPITQSVARVPLSQIWTRANVGEVLPDPVTPLTWAVFHTTLLKDLSRFWNQAEDEEPEGVHRIDGRVYIRLDGFLDSFCYLPAVSPGVMRQVLGVTIPPLAEAYSPPGGLLVRLSQALFWVDAFGLLPRLSWLSGRFPPVPSIQPVNLQPLLAWTANLFGLHLKATAYAIGAYAVLSSWVARWLPEDGLQLLPQVLVGQNDLQTAAQGRSLWGLAQQVRTDPTLLAAFRNIPDGQSLLAALQNRPDDSSGEFTRLWSDFMAQHGARAAGEFELATPRWREDPAFVLDVLRGYLAGPGHEDQAPRHSAQPAIDTISRRLNPIQSWQFRKLLAAYARYSTLRENLKYRLMEGYAGLRHIFLDEGDSLLSRGLLAQREEVFFLTPFEIRQAREGGLEASEVQKIVGQRRAQRVVWQGTQVPEVWVGEDRSANQQGAAQFSGIPASPGVVVGQARVLFSTQDAIQLQPGEILIAPHTDPGWTPLFLSCRAVVTEIGGFLSHGATVAREYGIPCVVNVPEVTTHIHTGDTLRVDGTTGRIELLKK